MSYMCCVCQECIFDDMLYECDRRHFHNRCLKCQMCGNAIKPELNDKLYAINGLLVCRKDYTQLKNICRVCNSGITLGELRFKTANSQQIHAKCMSCQSCRQSLERGDKYVFSADNRLLCHKCCHFTPFGGVGPQPPPANGGRRGRKRANNN